MNLRDPGFNLLTKINSVDYLQSWDVPNSKFDVELSFTWLDWRILELIIRGQHNFDLRGTDKEQRVQLCFNIWPLGRGVLHNLAFAGTKDEEGNQVGSLIKAYQSTIELF